MIQNSKWPFDSPVGGHFLSNPNSPKSYPNQETHPRNKKYEQWEYRAFKEIYPRYKIINTLWPWNGQTRKKITSLCVKLSNLPGFYWHLFWAPCWEFLSHMLHGTGIIIYFIIFLFQPNVGKYFIHFKPNSKRRWIYCRWIEFHCF